MPFSDTGLSIFVLANREDAEDTLAPFSLALATAHAAGPNILAGGCRCW